jgi:hypothetical protein
MLEYGQVNYQLNTAIEIKRAGIHSMTEEAKYKPDRLHVQRVLFIIKL